VAKNRYPNPERRNIVSPEPSVQTALVGTQTSIKLALAGNVQSLNQRVDDDAAGVDGERQTRLLRHCAQSIAPTLPKRCAKRIMVS